MDNDALPRLGIHRAGNLRPAFRYIGTRVGARVKPDLERIARRHGGIELDGHFLVSHGNQTAHTHALVDRAFKTHKLRARAASQIRVGKPAVKRPSQLTFERPHGIGIPRAITQHIERPAPRPHHVVDVVGVLHTPLDLERRHPGSNKLG